MSFFLMYWVIVLYIIDLLDLMDDEEEVLLALAEVLGPQFLDYVGGPAHALHIIKILEKLCQLDESTVRDKVRYKILMRLKACESIKKIFACLRLKDVEV
jgi:serine/threonine-protein phosphatase 2A regulatory subunit A